jgi:hypothetical protein
MKIKSRKELKDALSTSFIEFSIKENLVDNFIVVYDLPCWIVSLFLWKFGIAAITLGRLIFFFDDFNTKQEDILIHELVHVRQYKKYTWIGFLLKYFYEWLYKGYMMVSFEREAYKIQRIYVDYLREKGEL